MEPATAPLPPTVKLEPVPNAAQEAPGQEAKPVANSSKEVLGEEAPDQEVPVDPWVLEFCAEISRVMEEDDGEDAQKTGYSGLHSRSELGVLQDSFPATELVASQLPASPSKSVEALESEQAETTEALEPKQAETTAALEPKQAETTQALEPKQAETTEALEPEQAEGKEALEPDWADEAEQTKTAEALEPEQTKTTQALEPEHEETTSASSTPNSSEAPVHSNEDNIRIVGIKPAAAVHESLPSMTPTLQPSASDRPTAARPTKPAPKQTQRDADEYDDDDFDLGSLPPPMPTQEAIDQRLRRLTKPRKDGSFLLPDEVIKQWMDIKCGRLEVQKLFERCGFNPDRFLERSGLAWYALLLNAMTSCFLCSVGADGTQMPAHLRANARGDG